jgi:anti-sigma factor RsiW
MAFLYGEAPTARKNELQAHLERCPACSTQVNAWQASLGDLESWKVPARPPAPRQWAPVLKWAAAACFIVAMGFALGRRNSPDRSELAALRSSVAELSALVQTQAAANLSNSVAASTAAANAETVRLLSEYSQAQNEQRAADRQFVNLALRAFDARIDKVHTELETVAVNTETSFQETHDSLTRVASLSQPSDNYRPQP